MIDWNKTDSLIFDMDGTLWDAVDSYCAVWNECFSSFGIHKRLLRDELLECMGLPLDKIYGKVAGGVNGVDVADFLCRLEDLEKSMMPKLGGKPYPGVRDGIEHLSRKYVILLLSNCGEMGLTNMMEHVGITEFVTEAVTFGATRREKDANMVMLKQKYGLSQPVYVGDTDGDCVSTHKAGLPFAYVSYGFGKAAAPDITFSSFDELTSFFLKIKN